MCINPRVQRFKEVESGLYYLKWEKCPYEPWALFTQGQSEPSLDQPKICAEESPRPCAEERTGSEEHCGAWAGSLRLRGRLSRQAYGTSVAKLLTILRDHSSAF